MAVEQVRDVQVDWQVMSLAVLNHGRAHSTDRADFYAQAWLPVRVIVAAQRDLGDQVVKPLYDQMGRRIHLEGNSDYRSVIAESLAQLGLPAHLADYADSTQVDDLVRASHENAIRLVGDDVGTPVVAVGDIAFFGPVVSPAPTGEAAGRLWDGAVLVAGTPGFFELKRTRIVGPVLQ